MSCPTPLRAVVGRAAALVLAAALAASGCAGATDARLVGGRAASSTAPTTTVVPPPACLAELTTEQKAGQLLMVIVANPAEAGDAVAAGIVGGYTLVGPQPADVGAQIAATGARAPLPVFAAGDEEGGTVQRLRDVLGAIPSAADMARSMTPDDAASTFGAYASRLAELGLNMNLGPVLDVGGGSGLGTRSFGDDPEVVRRYGLAVADAIAGAGLVPVVKHWPGIGGGGADPHIAESPVGPLGELRRRDLVPFRAAIADGVPAIMVSHAIVPNLTEGLPASLSRPAITGELRETEGFDGLVVTDALRMGAVEAHFDGVTAAVVSLAAGADVALLGALDDALPAHAEVVRAIGDGRLPPAQVDRSVARVLRAKGIDGSCPPPGSPVSTAEGG